MTKRPAELYWDGRFTEGLNHHSNQNRQIATDFLAQAHNLDRPMAAYLAAAERVFEIGGGSGELADMFYSRYAPKEFLCTDLSFNACAAASVRFARHGLQFSKLDIMHMPDLLGTRYDLGIASNVLEHFKAPEVPLEAMFQWANRALILVPYEQPLSDGYDDEGGAGHVFTFREDWFHDHGRVLDWFTFTSNGWQHSTAGEEPLQLAVLVEKWA